MARARARAQECMRGSRGVVGGRVRCGMLGGVGAGVIDIDDVVKVAMVFVW